MKLYEGMFILNDARCTEDYNGTVGIVHEILTRHGAEIVDSRRWDERKLSYPIRRQSRGVFVLIHFNAPPLSIVQMERQFRLTSDVVLRDLILVDEDGVTMGPEKEAEHAAREEASARRAQRDAEKAEAAAAGEEAEEEGESEGEEPGEEAETEEEAADEEVSEEAETEEEPEEA